MVMYNLIKSISFTNRWWHNSILNYRDVQKVLFTVIVFYTKNWKEQKWNFKRNLKTKILSKLYLKLKFKIWGIGLILTLLYIENGKNQTKSVDILYQENFIRNKENKIKIGWNDPYIKNRKQPFWHLGAQLFRTWLLDRNKKHIFVEDHPVLQSLFSFGGLGEEGQKVKLCWRQTTKCSMPKDFVADWKMNFEMWSFTWYIMLLWVSGFHRLCGLPDKKVLIHVVLWIVDNQYTWNWISLYKLNIASY